MAKTAEKSVTPLCEVNFRSRQRLIWLYVGSVSLYWISLYLYVPTLPIYAYDKTGSLTLVGVILSMYGLWQAVIRLPLGIAADWLGSRKPLIIIGLVLCGVGSWMMGIATNKDYLIIGRAVTGFGASVWVLFIAAFSGLFPPGEAVRATILLTLANSVARMFATGATGWLNEYAGYQMPFYLATVAAAIAIIVLLPVREERFQRQNLSIQGIRDLITRRDVLIPSLLAAVSQYTNNAATFGFLPILAKQLGATNIMQGTLVSMSLGAIVAGNIISERLVRKIGKRDLVHLSFILGFFGTIGAAVAPSLAVVFLTQFLLGLSWGIGYPILMGMSIERVANTERATAMGLHQAVYAIGMFAGPSLSGILVDSIGIQQMFGVTAFACLALGLLGSLKLAK